MENNKRFKITISDADHADYEAEIRRTLTTLFATRAGSLPADRDFGISWECLDEVPEMSESLFYLEAAQKVEKYEPRVEINDIVFEQIQGEMTPHIYFTKKEEG